MDEWNWINVIKYDEIMELLFYYCYITHYDQ